MTSAEGRGHAHDGVTQGFCSHFFLGDDGWTGEARSTSA
jgi:hypothetical protein